MAGEGEKRPAKDKLVSIVAFKTVPQYDAFPSYTSASRTQNGDPLVMSCVA